MIRSFPAQKNSQTCFPDRPSYRGKKGADHEWERAGGQDHFGSLRA